MNKYSRFTPGFAVVPKGSSQSTIKGEIEFLTSDNKLYLHNGTVNDPIVQETTAATLTNKTMDGNDNTFLNITAGSLPDDVVYTDIAQTITNKDLSGNTSTNFVSGTGTLLINTSGFVTVPNGTDTLVNLTGTQTLSGKSMSGSANTFTAIPNVSLVNSSITINGSPVSLGGSVTIGAATANPLTIGTGLTGGSFDGSAPVTINIDTAVVVTLTGTQTLTNKSIDGNTNTITNIGAGSLPAGVVYTTGAQTLVSKTLTAPIIATISNTGTLTLPTSTDTLVGRATTDTLTNKTLTSPVITTPTTNTITGIAGGDLSLVSASNQNVIINGVGTGTVQLQKSGTTVATIPSTGITLATARNLVFTNNSQTVTLTASGSASASYTITLPAAAPTAGTALAYNGSSYVWSSAGGWTPATSASLTNGGTIAISLTTGQQVIDVQSASGAITLSNTPFGSSAPSNGTVVRLIGASNTLTVTLINNDATYGCILNGAATLSYGYVIELQYLTGYNRWFEVSRNF